MDSAVKKTHDFVTAMAADFGMRLGAFFSGNRNLFPLAPSICSSVHASNGRNTGRRGVAREDVAGNGN
jgi:hypothetical protein